MSRFKARGMGFVSATKGMGGAHTLPSGVSREYLARLLGRLARLEFRLAPGIRANVLYSDVCWFAMSCPEVQCPPKKIPASLPHCRTAAAANLGHASALPEASCNLSPKGKCKFSWDLLASLAIAISNTMFSADAQYASLLLQIRLSSLSVNL